MVTLYLEMKYFHSFALVCKNLLHEINKQIKTTKKSYNKEKNYNNICERK